MSKKKLVIGSVSLVVATIICTILVQVFLLKGVFISRNLYNQYKKYDKIQEELRPVKWFLNWCGDRYKDKSVSKYRFRIITKAKQFFLYKDIYFARDKEVEIPKDLQKRIVEVIEDWVDEKEQELKNI